MHKGMRTKKVFCGFLILESFSTSEEVQPFLFHFCEITRIGCAFLVDESLTFQFFKGLRHPYLRSVVTTREPDSPEVSIPYESPRAVPRAPCTPEPVLNDLAMREPDTISHTVSDFKSFTASTISSCSLIICSPFPSPMTRSSLSVLFAP